MVNRVETYPQEETTRANVRTQGLADVETVHEVESGSLAESIAAAGGVALAILGIIGVLPVVLGSIATIAVGVALFLGGGAIASRSLKVAHSGVRRQIVGGLGMEALAGLSGAVLGLLALLGISPLALLSVAAIVLGSALIMASAATTRLESALARIEAEPGSSHEAVYVASGSDLLVGAGAVVLGILALTGHDPLMLSLIAVLGIGAAGMLSGSTMAARFFALFGY